MAKYSMNKVIRKNTLTIGMGSTQIDIGILTDDVEYCISPAYSTFYINGINASYLREYLIWLNSILSAKYMITSVRQGKSVNKDELLNHPLGICDDKHQAIVAARFNMLRQKIGIETAVLNMLIKQRQYLLSTMFI